MGCKYENNGIEKGFFIAVHDKGMNILSGNEPISEHNKKYIVRLKSNKLPKKYNNSKWNVFWVINETAMFVSNNDLKFA